ncbi:MAG: mechanosensitive ion channel, partial [Deltaproteobacteria bacterium]|nr:mechanosensitive ion channel [Deltaproteobacteria bacterium]
MNCHKHCRLEIVVLACWAVMLLISYCYPAIAATPTATPVNPANQSPYLNLMQSIEKTLNEEKGKVEQLKAQLTGLKATEKNMITELGSIKQMIPAHSAMLLAADSEIEKLDKARMEQQQALDTMTERINQLSEQTKNIDQLRKQTDEQYHLNENQLLEVSTLNSKDKAIVTLIQRLKSLKDILTNKTGLLQKLAEFHAVQTVKWEETRDAVASMSKKYDAIIKERKEEEIFKRKDGPAAALGWVKIQEEINGLVKRLRLLLTRDLEPAKIVDFFVSGGFLYITTVLLLVIILAIFRRLVRVLVSLEQQPFFGRDRWRLLALRIFYRSFPLLGTTLALYLYSMLPFVSSSVPFLRAVCDVLLIWILCKWWLDFLTLWNEGEHHQVSVRLTHLLRLMLRVSFIFAIGYTAAFSLLGGAGALLLLGRLLFEFGFLGWSIYLGRVLIREGDAPATEKQSHSLNWRTTLAGLGYFIVGAGAFLELSGYGQLALRWYICWGLTSSVLLWGGLIFFIIREEERDFKKMSESETTEDKEKSLPIRWLLLRLSWVAWLGAVLTLVILAWGGKEAVAVGFVQVMTYAIPLGGMNLSLLGFVQAFLVLLFTHAATRLWRRFFLKTLLAKSGLALGVQESMASVSGYAIWAFGIISAFYALGLSATSLALAFGALGVGLGFGLQTIFNNFVSGIILLFERPIQVGDVIEIKGVTGTVKNIRVRSTVVQTWDNASLIIPNSDLISNQLTNWSFKDMRVRRSISIGAAYGVDVDLVKDALLEAADKHPLVLREPKPDVLFADFADSALVFKLRVWTSVQHAVGVESELRFEIDRLFRTRQIEIPYPKR